MPDFIYNFFVGSVHKWFPFWDVNTTPEVVASAFPYNVLGMLITMFLIYGMLIVRKITGNAWGCVMIFILYWNAL